MSDTNKTEAETGAEATKAARKFEPRDNVKDLNASARAFIGESMQDLDKYKALLDVMATFPDYSAMNCAHIAMHRPQATQLFSSQQIKDAGGFVNKGERGIPIVAPKFVAGKDGEPPKTFFNAKYLFARDQQHGAHLPYPKTYDQDTVLAAMAKVDTVGAPTHRDGFYVVGKHFGLEGTYLDQLPDLPQIEDAEAMLMACVSHADEVQYETKRFCFAVEQKCAELVSEKALKRNERAANMFARAATRAQEAGQDAPEVPAGEEQDKPAPVQKEARAPKAPSAKAKLAEAKARAEEQNAASPAREEKAAAKEEAER